MTNFVQYDAMRATIGIEAPPYRPRWNVTSTQNTLWRQAASLLVGLQQKVAISDA
jgi:hypothetical protein